MSLLLLVESQRMFIHKLKKQVQEYFVGFLLLLLLNWDNAPSHPRNSQERDIWKTLWTWEQELKPRICHFRFLLEIFWVLSSCVSLSLSRGHLRIKSRPYHFPVIMMHEPVRWPAFPGKISLLSVLQAKGGFTSPLLLTPLPQPLHH